MVLPPDVQLAQQQMLREHLMARGVDNPQVLEAMARVPRERFVATESPAAAYNDSALPIECGQTISQPYIVGLMTQALELTGREKVLEIGTGSGYQTSMLSQLAERVFSIERHHSLAQGAARLLHELGCRNVTLIHGDGTLGWPAEAPYDRIIVTAAADHIPPPLFEQLRDGGLLVIPIGGVECQVLRTVRKEGHFSHVVNLTNCRFVPLVGAQDQPG
jgi:protein-L-isoaspartate(D-aspartate) O-methyltransferase